MWPNWDELAGPLRVALRIGPLCALAPFLGARRTPAPVRIGLCAGLACAWGPGLGRPIGWVGWTGEALLGASAAAVAIVVFKSAETVGRLLDVVRGTHHAEVVAPDAGGRSSPLGRWADMLGLALFAELHGPALALAGLRRVAEAEIDLVTAWSPVFGAAVSIVVPPMIACLLTDLAFGLVARWAARLQAFLLALGPKSVVALLILALGGAAPWSRLVEAWARTLGPP